MRLLYAILFTVLVFSNGCFVSREYPVEYDYNFLGDFESYKSFDFFMTDTLLGNNQNKLIKSTIKNHLELLGYTYNPDKPSFYVNYFYINDSLAYKGYEQPKMESFVKYKRTSEKEKEKYQKKQFDISAGTFVINFTESDSYSMIWQGYTTDLYTDNIFDDPRKLRIAVISVLKNYAYVTNKKNN